MRRGSALIDAVEACYALDVRDRTEWLREVLAKVAPLLDDGRGGMAYAYDSRGAPERWSIERPVVRDAPEDIADATVQAFGNIPHEFRIRTYKQGGPVTTFVQLSGVTLKRMPSASARATARLLDMTNLKILNAANPDGRGVAFAFVTSTETRLSLRTHPHLAQLTSHVAAGSRLASALSSARDTARDAAREAAVFDPGGKAVHLATDSAITLRDDLRTAVMRSDRARGRLRRTDEREALSMWQALVAGRWSLVDRFESDGRRYIVAYENPPDVADPRALTPDERAVAGWIAHGHPDKVIAYELGRPEGTVRATVHRVLKKLGLRSRVDVVRAMLEVDANVDDDVEVEVDLGVPRVRALIRPIAAPSSALPMLSAAEREVAILAARGLSNAEIAERRGRSERTIANQLAGIFAKLGVRSRAELTRLLG